MAKKQLTITTKGLDFDLRDREVMLVLLKLVAFYQQKSRTLYLGKWTKFFNALFPEEVKKGSVFAVGRAKKFLVEKEYVKIIQPQGKEYHLLAVNPDKIETIIEVLNKFTRDYDEELFELIEDYYNTNDSGLGDGKFKSSVETFSDMGL